MQEYSRQQLNGTFKQLPMPVKTVITSEETAETIDQIGTKFNLHIDEKGKLGSELGLMLMGLRSPQDFATALKTKIGISDEVTRQIVGEVNTQIFIPLKEQMQASGIKPIEPQVETAPPEPKQIPNIFADEPATQAPKEEAVPVEEPEIPTQIPVQAPTEEKKIEKKYAIDPYREPIE